MSSRILLTVTSPRWLGARGAGCVVGEGAGWNCTVGPALGALMVGWHPGTGQTVGSDDAMWCAQREWPQRRVSGAARVCAQRGQARTSRRESMVVVGRARTAGASVRYNGVDSHRRRRAQSLDPARSIGRGQGACIGTCPASTGPDLHQLGTARARPPIRQPRPRRPGHLFGADQALRRCTSRRDKTPSVCQCRSWARVARAHVQSLGRSAARLRLCRDGCEGCAADGPYPSDLPHKAFSRLFSRRTSHLRHSGA